MSVRNFLHLETLEAFSALSEVKIGANLFYWFKYKLLCLINTISHNSLLAQIFCSVAPNGLLMMGTFATLIPPIFFVNCQSVLFPAIALDRLLGATFPIWSVKSGACLNLFIILICCVFKAQNENSDKPTKLSHHCVLRGRCIRNIYALSRFSSRFGQHTKVLLSLPIISSNWIANLRMISCSTGLSIFGSSTGPTWALNACSILLYSALFVRVKTLKQSTQGQWFF